jgi:hypothetical protein
MSLFLQTPVLGGILFREQDSEQSIARTLR